MGRLDGPLGRPAGVACGLFVLDVNWNHKIGGSINFKILTILYINYIIHVYISEKY